MGKKGETREKGPMPQEWNKFVHQVNRLAKTCEKARAEEKLRQLRKKICPPRNQ